jgi:hypothetical protein
LALVPARSAVSYAVVPKATLVADSWVEMAGVLWVTVIGSAAHPLVAAWSSVSPEYDATK